MSEKKSESDDKPIGGEILDGARRIADDADRWFVSLARGLGRTARWTTGEAKMVAEAAVAAGRTTGRVTKQMLSRMRVDEADDDGPEPASLTAALNALGQIVEECPGDDYRALRNNRQFWRALSRLQKLRREAAAAAKAPSARSAATKTAATKDGPASEPEGGPASEPEGGEATSSDEEGTVDNVISIRPPAEDAAKSQPPAAEGADPAPEPSPPAAEPKDDAAADTSAQTEDADAAPEPSPAADKPKDDAPAEQPTDEGTTPEDD